MNVALEDKVQQGIELMAATRFEEARAVFSVVLSEDARNYDAALHLGNAYVNLERYDDAITSFKKAQLIRPDSNEVLYSLGCCYFLKASYVEALRYFNRCEERGFAVAEMYGLMEVIFIESEDYTQAIRCANKAIQVNPLDPQPYIDKAQLYVLQGKPQEAVSCLREVEELLPDSGEPYIVESQILLQNDDSEQALKVLDRAIERFPGDVPMLLVRARALNNLARYPEALQTLGHAQDLEHDAGFDREIAMQVSIAQAGLKNVDSSIETLEASIAAHPADGDSLFLLVNECYALKQFEKAERYGKRLLEMEDVDPHYRAAGIFWHASAINEQGRTEEAREAFEEAITTLRQLTISNPGLFEVYIYRAMCNKELGNFEEAITLIDHVIALLPEEAAGYAFKLQILEARGDSSGAHEMKQKVLELDPNFEF